jgi:hypothetical protein
MTDIIATRTLPESSALYLMSSAVTRKGGFGVYRHLAIVLAPEGVTPSRIMDERGATVLSQSSRLSVGKTERGAWQQERARLLAALNAGEFDPAQTSEHGSLLDYATGDFIRPATADESSRSIASAEITGGAGVITVDGRSCYVD